MPTSFPQTDQFTIECCVSVGLGFMCCFVSVISVLSAGFLAVDISGFFVVCFFEAPSCLYTQVACSDNSWR